MDIGLSIPTTALDIPIPESDTSKLELSRQRHLMRELGELQAKLQVNLAMARAEMAAVESLR